MKSYFKCFIAIFSLLFSLDAAAQMPEVVSIDEEGISNSDNCQVYFILTDSNADNGDYEENEDYEVTLCFNDIEMSNAQVQIFPTNPETGAVWDVDANSSLFIYEGTGTGGNLLGEFNSISDPDGVFFTTDVACLTFVFVSGSNSSGMGFQAIFKCVEPLQPFDFDVLVDAPLEYSDIEVTGIPSDASIITICYSDSIHLNAVLDFPFSNATGNGYEQSLDNTFITYSWGDNSSESGFGLTSVSHAYEPFGGFYIYITAEDQMGQVEFFEIFVLVAPRPLFSGILFNDTLCAGDTTFLTGGILNFDTVGVDPAIGLVNYNYEYSDSLALPDGNGVLYSTDIDISGFAGGPTLQEPGDIQTICINMEHSYLGDLEAWITCPDGSTALLFDGFGGTGQYPNGQAGFGGGSTFLGDPLDDDSQPMVQGVGFDYCFSDILADLGTMQAEFIDGNTVPVTTGNAMVAGTYIPAESFDNLIGCPLNGSWTLSIGDNIGSDNGFIFGWEITFSDDFERDSIFYSPDIVDAYWLENPDIVQNNGTDIVVVPSIPGDNQYTFVAEDSFGCLHDTTFYVYVRPQPDIDDAVACDLTWVLVPTNAPASGVWEVVSTPSENSEVSFNYLAAGVAEIEVSEYGFYEFLITESNCGYTANAVIDFRPDPIVAPFPDDVVLCVGGSIVLDAGPQEDNSDNFNIVWTQNGNVINAEDYAINVDATGDYLVNISGVCGSDSDTINVVAITLSFEGQMVCGLQAFGSASLSPSGSVLWSADSPEISFSAVNQLNTAISAQQYGSYNITVTDSRCPADGVTEEFTFVEAPDVSILPQNPDFCVESEALLLTTDLSGNNDGNFIWTINGQNQVSQNDSLFFPAPASVNPDNVEFEPLVDYTISIIVRDEFGICPLGLDTIYFEGNWCTYNIPNIITPNGDRRNDNFHVEFIQFFPNTHLRIFDRWGRMVFDQPNYDQYQAGKSANGSQGGWDPGDNNAGTYFYELNIPRANVTETGNIEVLDGTTTP